MLSDKIRFNPFKRFTKESFHIPEKLAAYDGLGWPAKAVYGALLTFFGPKYNPKFGIWPDMKTIGELIGMKKQSVSQHIKTLVDGGFIEVEVINGDHHYFLLWHLALGDLPEDIKAECSQENLTGAVKKTGQGSQETRTSSQEKLTGSQEILTPCNEEGNMTMKHDHESSSSHPEADPVPESNKSNREQLDGMNEIALLLQLEPLAGGNFHSRKYGNWILAGFTKSDIRELLIKAILDGSTIDWVNEQLEARRAQRKEQQGGNQHAGSRNRANSGFGL